MQRLFEKAGLIATQPHDSSLFLIECHERAINDACEYIGCNKIEFFDLARKWHDLYPELLAVNVGDEFYKNCRGEIGYCNICVNIEDQFNRKRVFKAVSLYIKPGMKVLDFGAATGVLSYCFKDIAGEIHFQDFENELAGYLRSRIDGYPNLFWHNIEAPGTPGHTAFDFIVCVDVLEHLKNPSEIFVSHMHSKLKTGGILLLTAPWGGHPTHLKEAPIDWYGTGAHFISRKYRLEFIIEPSQVSGIYRKLKN